VTAPNDTPADLTPARLDEMEQQARDAKRWLDEIRGSADYAVHQIMEEGRLAALADDEVEGLCASVDRLVAEVRRLWAEAARPTPRSPEDEEAMDIIRRAAAALRAKEQAPDSQAATREEAEHIATLALSDPDEEGDCLRCHRTMASPDRSEGEEPTALCAACAQAVLPMLAAEVRRLRAQAATPDPIDDLLEKLAAEARAVPEGAAAHGGPLHDAPIFNLYRWAEQAIRRLTGKEQK
jgi:hypothetical protein